MMTPELRSLAVSLSPRLKRSGSTFWLLIALLPPRLRHPLTVLYLYCRVVDDCADAPADRGAETGLTRLLAWEKALETGDHPEDPSLARAVLLLRQQYALPRTALLAVIEGCRQDLEAPLNHPRQPELDEYCDRVAGAVGTMILCLCGFPPPTLAGFAQSAGRALQYTNILRDLAEDADRGRCYLPASTPPEALAEEADRLFQACLAERASLPPKQRRQLAPAIGFIRAYHHLLRALRKRGFDKAAQRCPVVVNRWHLLGILIRMTTESWR